MTVTPGNGVHRVSVGLTVDRIRAFLRGRPDLVDLLGLQARDLPERVFGPAITGEQFLEIYIQEALNLLELSRRHLGPGVRLLEVGSGLGLFHVLARAEKLDISSVEPSVAGFTGFRAVGSAIVSALGGVPGTFVDARAESLPWPDGSFPLVLSHNVLEHVKDPAAALAEMYRVLAPGGTMLHFCPNYLFPYEPHYKVPVIPCAVGLSGRLIWRGFCDDPLWRSLNSISSVGVRRAAAGLPAARLRFLRVVPLTLQRLGRDASLSRRHGWLARLALWGPVRALLESLPPEIVTPMAFEIEKGVPT